MANRKIACKVCGKKFHSKGISGHLRSHDKKQYKQNKAFNDFLPPQISPMSVSEREQSYKQGYQAGQEEQRRRTGDARIALVESVAKLNQALAGVLDEFRQG